MHGSFALEVMWGSAPRPPSVIPLLRKIAKAKDSAALLFWDHFRNFTWEIHDKHRKNKINCCILVPFEKVIIFWRWSELSLLPNKENVYWGLIKMTDGCKRRTRQVNKLGLLTRMTNGPSPKAKARCNVIVIAAVREIIWFPPSQSKGWLDGTPNHQCACVGIRIPES